MLANRSLLAPKFSPEILKRQTEESSTDLINAVKNPHQHTNGSINN
jgi:hypothetical protein